MKKVNYIKNLMLTAILLMSFAFTAKAQTWANPKYVCEDNANGAINLSTQVVGNGFSPAGGKWYKLDPAGSYSYDATNETVSGVDVSTLTAADEVSNVFLIAGKPVGKYVFLYVATTTNSCIPKGKHRLATIHILATPKDASFSVALCPSETYTVNLKSLLPANLVTKAQFTATTLATGLTLDPAAGTVAVNGTYEGQFTVPYTLNHGAGVTDCVGPANIVINVTRDAATTSPALLGQPNITYCVDQIPASLNLNTFITTTAPGASWAGVQTTGTSGAPTVTNTGGAGTATFPTGAVAGDVFTFTYTWTAVGCRTAGSVAFTVTILADGALAIADKSLEVCKLTTPDRVINMLVEGLGVGIPLSSGVWIDTPNHTNPSNVTVSDGLFEVADSRDGTYKYTFDVSNATSVCGLINASAVLTLEVKDPSASQDGNMQFCITDIQAETGNLNLAQYIAGLPSSGVTWTSNVTGVPVVGTGNNEIAYAQLAARGLGTHLFEYSYDAGSCGKAEGKLYITVTDKLDMPNNVAVSFCRPDITGPIDLTNLIGVDVPGNWTIAPDNFTAPDTSSLSGDHNRMFKENAGTSNTQTYTATFTPATTNCGAVPVTLTIVISDDDF